MNIEELRTRVTELEASGDSGKLAEAKADLAERERLLDDAERRGRDPRYVDGPDTSGRRRRGDYEDEGAPRTFLGKGTAEARNMALRAIEAREGDISPAAADRLDRLVRHDRSGADSAYVTSIANPDYEKAFERMLFGQGPERGLSAEMGEAVEAVAEAMATRAIGVGSGALGGFAVPFALDPTVNLVTDGAVNPIRQLATVIPISATTWKGVNSEGVEAVFGAEASESEDAGLELTQPEITPEKAQIWQPYSIEAGEDWQNLSAELMKCFADARDVKEAEIFATGKGKENVPQGLIVGATEVVETTGSKAVAVGDVYGLQEALPPRYQPRATWLAANAVANQIYRFVAAGDTEEPHLMSEARDAILGKPYREVSTMSAKTTTEKELVLAYGDIAASYKIVDRIGMTVEPIQNVLVEGKPTGQRGLYGYFRVGAKVTNANGVRVLKVRA